LLAGGQSTCYAIGYVDSVVDQLTDEFVAVLRLGTHRAEQRLRQTPARFAPLRGPQPAVVVTRVPPIVFLIGRKNIPNKEARRMASTTKPNPIPDSYRRVTPCLIVQGGDKALKFYAEVFEATERMRFPNPDGTVGHAEIEIGDSVVIVEEESRELGTKAPQPGGLAGSPAFLYVYVEDVDDVVARAVKLGAQLQRPPQDQFYGDRDGYIVDPFGHGWTVSTHVEDVEPAELMRRMAEMQGV
jgi:PhnB protein